MSVVSSLAGPSSNAVDETVATTAESADDFDFSAADPREANGMMEEVLALTINDLPRRRITMSLIGLIILLCSSPPTTTSLALPTDGDHGECLMDDGDGGRKAADDSAVMARR